jgi:hypothetical protein
MTVFVKELDQVAMETANALKQAKIAELDDPTKDCDKDSFAEAESDQE